MQYGNSWENALPKIGTASSAVYPLDSGQDQAQSTYWPTIFWVYTHCSVWL